MKMMNKENEAMFNIPIAKINALINLLRETKDKNIKAMILQSFIAEYGPVPDEYGGIIKGILEEEAKEREDKTMAKYIVVTYRLDKYGNIGDEWFELETDNRNEAIERAVYEADTSNDPHYGVELREIDEVVDVDEDGEMINYNYSSIDFHMEAEKLQLLRRSRLFNMKAVCEAAGVSYGSWRQFKNGNQGLNNRAYEKLKKVMDQA